ncbi:hypothetical protein CGCA056_v006244 [Colletotrichum aenigma]|uniref:uncharacterized protein n=1 Tax=Colletotrichum aenigma TaxID=1215731 RepID=UPI001872670A|nr:uncharacterized protein CGCA056_v006244 [Colletotrichum aenigma]KAF5522658.1 hypothetical protein CGCA056_v006244 [Colletotrichum aenigma]
MSLPSELTAAVQCLGRHLDTVRQRACDREHLVRATLDSERTALEHKIADNQNRKKEVEALLEVWEHENADAFQRLARLEASYHDSLQRSRSLDAVPDYQHLVGFIFGSASVPARTPSSLPYMHTQDAMMMSEIQNNPEDKSAVASLRRQMAERIASHQFDQGHTNDIGHCLPKTQNSIDFEELYEGGKAKYKHRILYFKGQWYILKCDEHGIHFPYRSASAAGSHLRSHWHRGSASNYAAVIKAFGVRVENCNGERADRNNEEFLSALASGYCVYKGTRESQKRQSTGMIPFESTYIS